MIGSMLVMTAVGNVLNLVADGIQYNSGSIGVYHDQQINKLILTSKLLYFLGDYISISILTYINWRFALGDQLDESPAIPVEDVDAKSQKDV